MKVYIISFTVKKFIGNLSPCSTGSWSWQKVEGLKSKTAVFHTMQK